MQTAATFPICHNRRHQQPQASPTLRQSPELQLWSVPAQVGMPALFPWPVQALPMYWPQQGPGLHTCTSIQHCHKGRSQNVLLTWSARSCQACAVLPPMAGVVPPRTLPRQCLTSAQDPLQDWGHDTRYRKAWGKQAGREVERKDKHLLHGGKSRLIERAKPVLCPPLTEACLLDSLGPLSGPLSLLSCGGEIEKSWAGGTCWCCSCTHGPRAASQSCSPRVYFAKGPCPAFLLTSEMCTPQQGGGESQWGVSFTMYPVP